MNDFRAPSNFLQETHQHLSIFLTGMNNKGNKAFDNISPEILHNISLLFEKLLNIQNKNYT